MRARICLISLAVCSASPSAYADSVGTYLCNYSISLKSHATASLVAAGLMGAQGYTAYSAPTGWENSFAEQCTFQTRSWRGFTDPRVTTSWPGDCDPLGMAYALDATAGTGHGWGVTVLGKWEQKSAFETIITALQKYQSPAVIPLFGSSNHWVAVQKMVVTYYPDDFEITSAFIYDASPGIDSFSKKPGAALDGRYELKKNESLRAVYSMLDVPDDTTYDSKYVVVFDPPPGASVLPDPELTRRNLLDRRAPGLFLTSALDASTATSRLWEALQLGGSSPEELQTWQKDGFAGVAQLVRGHYPSGQERNYYLIPIRARQNPVNILAMVEMSEEEGAVLAIYRAATPWAYQTLSFQEAQCAAATLLAAGERLGGGSLTWNPAATQHPLKAPYFPFYQFDIYDQAGRVSSAALVAHHNAAVRTRVAANYRARILNQGLK